MIVPVVNEISNVGMNGPNEVAGTEINTQVNEMSRNNR